MRARMLKSVLASPPWCKRVCVEVGEIVDVKPATNMPEDSKIKYWIHGITGDEPWIEHCYYGIGAYIDDVEILP